MKKIRLFLLATLIFCTLMFVSNSVNAQFSFGLNGSAAFSDVQGSKTLYGGGSNFKIFFSPHVDFGVGIKYIGESHSIDYTNNKLDYSVGIIPITAMFDYYFTKGLLRPYVGTEAGVYVTNASIKFNGETASTSSPTNAGVAPKVGLMLALGPIGIYAEGVYNVIFGNRDGSTSVGNLNNINYQNTSKFFMISVGLQIGVPHKK